MGKAGSVLDFSFYWLIFKSVRYPPKMVREGFSSFSMI